MLEETQIRQIGAIADFLARARGYWFASGDRLTFTDPRALQSYRSGLADLTRLAERQAVLQQQAAALRQAEFDRLAQAAK